MNYLAWPANLNMNYLQPPKHRSLDLPLDLMAAHLGRILSPTEGENPSRRNTPYNGQ